MVPGYSKLRNQLIGPRHQMMPVQAFLCIMCLTTNDRVASKLLPCQQILSNIEDTKVNLDFLITHTIFSYKQSTNEVMMTIGA